MDKIKKFFSKQSVGFYLGCAAILLSLVTLILYCINGNYIYYKDFQVGIFLAILGSFLLVAAFVVLAQFYGNNKFLTIALVGAALLLGIFAFLFINDRIETIAFVFASELEANNPFAQIGTRQAIATFVFFMLSWLTVVVASFFNIVKSKECCKIEKK